MAVQAGRVAKIKVCATDGSYVEPLGVTSIKAVGWKSADQMVTTQQGDTASRSISSGFYGACSLDVEFNRDAADSTGQEIILANNPCWVQYAEDGSTYRKCQMSWTASLSHAAGGDTTKMSVSFKPAGGTAPAAV